MRCLLFFLCAPLALAQGTAADYARAAGLDAATRNKVFRARVDPIWAEDGASFWYRVATGPRSHAFVFVDARRGERRPAFDHERLATALGDALEEELRADRLPLEELAFAEGEVAFDARGQRFRLTLADYAIERVAGQARRRGLEPVRGVGRSRRTGRESEVQFFNERPGPIEIFWLDSDGGAHSYGRIEPGASHRQHTFGGHVWEVRDEEGRRLAVYEAADRPGRAVVDASLPRPEEQRPPRGSSPDGRWQAFVRDHDLFLRALETGELRRLSTDGSAEDAYNGRFHWSPDSSRLVAMRRRPGQGRMVHVVESSPDDQLQPRLHSFRYDKPGDVLERQRPALFDVETGAEIPLDEELYPNPWSIRALAWDDDSQRFSFLYNERGHQLLRLVGVGRDGAQQSLIEERSATFIEYANKAFFRRLPSGEMLWSSERDGWHHLYLYGPDGRLLRQLTAGEWVVRGLLEVDSERREVWFSAGGIHPGQDPYQLHLCRVSLDGGPVVPLTASDGSHEWELAPDGQTLLARWSRVDQPPVHELRDARTGALMCELERADASRLEATGWRAPERFVAPGRDGETPIHGIIIRPRDFSPERSYPVLEHIYAGPHSAHVPKTWGRQLGMRRLAELGFVVVQIDGMGTSHRSKAFHDVCWRNLGDAGFPDRIAWLKAAAEEHPGLDLTRVGIYGGSAGGQNALRGLLAHPDFYKVGVADCGCHDNRMDKVWWNELWMGWPLGEHYAASSNVTLAHQLEGKLLLIVGELDRNVDPASTMQVVAALIEADKDFDLLVMPGIGHGAAGTRYGRRRQADFFVRHLWGREPRGE